MHSVQTVIPFRAGLVAPERIYSDVGVGRLDHHSRRPPLTLSLNPGHPVRGHNIRRGIKGEIKREILAGGLHDSILMTDDPYLPPGLGTTPASRSNIVSARQCGLLMKFHFNYRILFCCMKFSESDVLNSARFANRKTKCASIRIRFLMVSNLIALLFCRVK